MNTPENMEAYLDKAYAPEKLRAELSDAHAAIYFLYWGDKLAGYLKLNESSAQTDIHDGDSLEIERIYVTKAFQGQGLGHYLIDQAIDAALQQKKEIYMARCLGEKTPKPSTFYKQHGFYQIGAHSFVVGDDQQTDLLMRKDLEVQP